MLCTLRIVNQDYSFRRHGRGRAGVELRPYQREEAATDRITGSPRNTKTLDLQQI